MLHTRSCHSTTHPTYTAVQVHSVVQDVVRLIGGRQLNRSFALNVKELNGQERGILMHKLSLFGCRSGLEAARRGGVDAVAYMQVIVTHHAIW